MKYQVCGYDFVKNGEWTILHLIDLRQSKSGAGYRPFVVKGSEGLWVPRSMNFVATKELLNKVINVEFGPSGHATSITVEK